MSLTREIEDPLGEWLQALAKRFEDASYRPEEIKSQFGLHGCTYQFDEDDEYCVTIGFTLPSGVFAEIEDETFGELQGFRIYVEPEYDPEPRNPQNNTYSGDDPGYVQDMRDAGRPGL